MTQNEWILSNGTGISSKTMWAAVNDVDVNVAGFVPDIPHDASDIGSCIGYYRQCELTDSQMDKIGDMFPWFKPYIESWGMLCVLYDDKDWDNLHLVMREMMMRSYFIKRGQE